jgi:hypothetical protein
MTRSKNTMKNLIFAHPGFCDLAKMKLSQYTLLNGVDKRILNITHIHTATRLK